MKLKRFLQYLFLVLCLFNTSYIEACQCPITNLSKQECDKYDVIFRGKIIKNSGCINKNGEAVFEILELYKGRINATFKVLFECEVECAQAFNIGEEWIIYTNYKQADNAKMDWCSRSRKFIKNAKEDFYAVTYGNDYDDELKFLRETLGTYKVMKDREENQAGKRNIIPSKTQLIITLFISLAVVILFLQLFKKFFK